MRAKFASAASLPPGLIALWRGETNASDLLGANHGAFFAGPVEVTPSVLASGKVGGAFHFDGTVMCCVSDTCPQAEAVYGRGVGVSHSAE